MPDMMAIVSKAVFDTEAPKAKLGVVLPMKRYRSASKHLSRLDEKSRLFLVTVRPPNEALWLVAVLEQLKFDGNKWDSAPNRYPVSDIGPIKGKLKFDSGKGLVAKPGALGMSLQTPRVLTDADAELLLQAAGAPKSRERPPGPVNLSAHQDDSPLPCLCRDCLPSVPATCTVGGAEFFRAQAEARGRVLWFWVPIELRDEQPAVVEAVAEKMTGNLKPLSGAGGDQESGAAEDEDDDE